MKKPNERKVFVFNGYGNTGGAFINYNIGRICHKKFGSEVFMVHQKKAGKIKGESHPRFHYKYEFPVIDIETMKEMGDAEDIFICNPAHSTKWFGPNFPMKKLMYMQGINTFPVLDIYYDHYVSVSRFVRDHVSYVFNVKSQIISPFINHSVFKNKTPWKKRSDEILILNYKGYAGVAFERLNKEYKKKYPNDPLNFKIINTSVTQEELADLYNAHKYFLTLNPVEGFGLPPLEAMASGSAVIGFDSMGGRDYFENGQNALIVPYGDFDQLADVLYRINQNMDLGESLAKRGEQTAGNFSYENFEKHWTEYLAKHVYEVR
ncbi:MAG: glycosyltransferase family 4 protein [Tuberibacillus sp.]